MVDTFLALGGSEKGWNMAWQGRSLMELREEFVHLALSDGANRRQLCRRFGIGAETGHKWLRRYATSGAAGLVDRSRRPHGSPWRSAAAIEDEVLRVRKAHPSLQRTGASSVPAASTITAILRRHDKLDPAAAAQHRPVERFERAAPNELWQIDFKGHFAMASGRCHPLTVLDGHSRYSLGLEACANEREAVAKQRLTATFRRYGLPLAMLMDNGAPWGDDGAQPYTRFTVWLLRLGIQVIHGRPYHPQTQGKDERFHRALKAEVLAGRHFRDLTECQHAFDRWRHCYNFDRPHQAIDMAVPGERYRPSQRSLPERLPEIAYGPDDIVRKVQAGGFISFRNRRIRLSKAFRGYPVTVRPTPDDGVFTVHSCSHAIAQIDLRNGQTNEPSATAHG